jgi:hypothetical protein
MRKHPSGAKAPLYLEGLTDGLKPVPFKKGLKTVPCKEKRNAS